MDKFDRYVKLAKLAAARFDARRSYEWKIIIGFWVVMLTTLHKDWHLPQVSWGVWYRIIVGVIFVLVFAMTWIRGIWAGNRNDKNRYELCFTNALRLTRDAGEVKGNDERITFCESLKFIFDWNSQFQIIVTAFLVALVLFQL